MLGMRWPECFDDVQIKRPSSYSGMQFRKVNFMWVLLFGKMMFLKFWLHMPDLIKCPKPQPSPFCICSAV